MNLLSFIVCLFFPPILKPWALNLLGHEIDRSANIGFNYVWGCKMTLSKNTKIGHLNYIVTTRMNMGEGGIIRDVNVFSGPFTIDLKKNVRIGRFNKITRAKSKGLHYTDAVFSLGVLSGLTNRVIIDCTRSVSIGDYCQIAGVGTQLWTHGYYHDRVGPGRVRVDGEINIGNNVYIGSLCVVNSGVRISDGITIGSCSCVSKSLLVPGTYVSQPLRYLETTDKEVNNSIFKVTREGLMEEVYEKKFK